MKTIKSSKKSSLRFLVFCLTLLLADPTVFAATNNEAKALYQNALKLSQQKKWDEAVAEFGKASELSPEDSLIHANLGVAFSQTGMHKEALLSFEKALQLGYDSPRPALQPGRFFCSCQIDR